MKRADEILAMMDNFLVDLPTTRANQQFVADIEASANAEVEEDYRLGYMTYEEHELIISAFHKRLHPD